MAVPFLDLQRQYRAIAPEVEAAILDVARSGRYVGNAICPRIRELEKAMCRYTGAAHAIAVGSGTDALVLSLMALDVGPGDEVVTTPFTFFATAGAIARLGARPVFADIEADGYNIDARDVARKITRRTKVILPVHLYGQCADMDRITSLAVEYGLHIIEDAAQAMGGRFRGEHAGTIGRAGCFSFFPGKNLGSMGEAGMVVTSDAELADRMYCLREHGSRPKYHHRLVGGNFRMDTVQAAVLLAKLPYLDAWIEKRRKNAEGYRKEFSHFAFMNGQVVLPLEMTGNVHAFNVFTVRARDRDGLAAHLKTRNVGCETYYPKPLHLQECFAVLGYREGALPNAELTCREALALPVFPELEPDEIREVVAAIAEFYLSSPETDRAAGMP